MAAVLMSAAGANAQDMPDPSQIHGRAIPAPELPNGTVTVRVVREAIGNNMPDQQVRVTAGGATQTATTDTQGRAEFRNLPSGVEARAEASVEGEQLTSQPFPVPATGGLRVILVAGIERATERKKQEEAAAAAAPATRGIVVLGGNTRVLMQFNDDRLQVFYILEIVNNARARVDIGGPLVIDLPRVAQGARVLEGSSPTATVDGTRVIVTGPFASGSTMVQVGYAMPYSSSQLTLTQTWPATIQQVTVAIEKLTGVEMSSPQFATTNEVTAEDGTVFVLGSGPSLQAGGTLELNISNLPAHSQMPRNIALALAVGIGVFGAWLAATGHRKRGEEHEALLKRRSTLLGQLAQLEAKRRAGGDSASYNARRQRIVSELEQIYGELDDPNTGPQGGGEGVAA